MLRRRAESPVIRLVSQRYLLQAGYAPQRLGHTPVLADQGQTRAASFSMSRRKSQQVRIDVGDTASAGPSPARRLGSAVASGGVPKPVAQAPRVRHIAQNALTRTKSPPIEYCAFLLRASRGLAQSRARYRVVAKSMA